ncbi:MAG: FkbM family methyltransferase [Acidobacteria bacterium]|nr:FkbM family methyltransferase [Acidobacteriota bacterium]
MTDRETAQGGTGAAREPASAAGVPAPRRCELPNGMEVAYHSRAEVGFFYQDIFEKQIYVRHGVELKDGDCVFDVGANVGFFTLFAHRRARNVRVYAFEPAPPLFEALGENVARHGVNARLFNCGVSDRSRTAAFTFYPNSSGMSSFYADEREEREALRAIMQNQLRQGVEGMEQVMRHADELLDERLKALNYECRLRTLSEVIAEERVGVIDFLKIDVQKSELDVLRGVADGDWQKIRQIVIEVHDLSGRLDEIRRMLEDRGYAVAVEQDDHYEESILYNLFARRADARPETQGAAGRLDEEARRQARERARRQEEAMSRRRQLTNQKKGR